MILGAQISILPIITEKHKLYGYGAESNVIGLIYVLFLIRVN